MNSVCESNAIMDRIAVHDCKPYPTYKRSGVEWPDNLPAHWVVRRLRASLDGCISGTWGSDPTGFHDLPPE